MLSRGRFHMPGLLLATTIVLRCCQAIGYSQSYHPWPSFRFDPGLTAQAQVFGPAELYLFDTILCGGTQNVMPVVASEGVAFFVHRDGNKIFKIAASGSCELFFPRDSLLTTGDFKISPTLGNNDLLYIGTTDGRVYAIDRDGNRAAQRSLQGEIKRPLNFFGNDTLVVLTEDGYVYLLEATTLQILQERFVEPRQRSAAPAVDVNHRLIYYGFDNAVFAFDAATGVVKSAEFPAEFGNVFWVLASPHPSHAFVFAGFSHDSLSAIVALESGFTSVRDTLWISRSIEFGTPHPAALRADGALFVVSEERGEIKALAAGTGAEVWNYRLAPGTNRTTMPVIDAAGRIYAAFDGVVYAFSDRADTCSTDSCKVLSALDTGHQLFDAPAFGPDGRILFPAANAMVAITEVPHAHHLQLESAGAPTGCIETPQPDSIQVRINDQFGRPFAGQTVRFEVIAGDGNVSNDSTTSDRDGIARTRWTLGPVAGRQELTVEAISPKTGQPLYGSPVSIVAQAFSPAFSARDSLVFPTIAIHDTLLQLFVITNDSDCPLVIRDASVGGADPASFFFKDTLRDRVVPGRQARPFKIGFAPTTVGPHETTLTILSNSESVPVHEVALSGGGIAGLNANPHAIDFGILCVEETVSKTFVLRNNSSGSITVEAISVSDTAFRVKDRSFVMSAGTMAIDTVWFQPTAMRDYPASVDIYYNIRELRLFSQIVLSGTGFAPQFQGDDSLRFGPATVGKTTYREYTFFNRGVAPCSLRVGATSITGPNALEFAISRASRRTALASGEADSISIAFTPMSLGVKSATLHVASNDPGRDTMRIALSGKGAEGAIFDSWPQSLDFSQMCLDSANSLPLHLTNSGTEMLIIESLRYSSTAFKGPLQVPPLAPAETLQVDIRFCPSLAQTYAETLRIFHSDVLNCGSPAVIALRGTGVSAQFQAAPQLIFERGHTCGASQKNYAINNPSTCPLLIRRAWIDGMDAAAFQLVSPDNNIVVPAQGSHQMLLRFTPPTTGTWWAALYLETNVDGNQLFVTQLQGTALVDTTAPEALADFTVTPPAWSRDSTFVLNWSNPADSSGIDSVFYKFDEPPMSNSDWSGSFKASGMATETLEVIAPRRCKVPIHAWLKDGCGNADHRKHARSVLRFDDQEPEIRHRAESTVELNHTFTVFASAKDTLSGIERVVLSYHRGGEPDFVTITLRDSIAMIPADFATARGLDYAVSARDNAGNLATLKHSSQVLLPPIAPSSKQKGGRTGPSYRLISFPLEMADTSVAGFARRHRFELTDALVARLWDIDPDSADSIYPFREYPDTTSGFVPGKAMFLITKNNLVLESAPGRTLRTDGPYVIPLRHGWNLFANPYNFSIPIQNLSPERLQSQVYYYDDKWELADASLKLEPWQGYAIRVDSADSLTKLLIHPEEKARASRAIFDVTVRAEWFIRIRATCHMARDISTIMGVMREASRSTHEYDRREPPPVGDFVAAYFRQATAAGDTQRFTYDFRPPSTDGYEWDFQVATNIKHNLVLLDFELSDKMPMIRLIDKDFKVVRDLRLSAKYTYASGSEGGVRRFKLLVGDHDYVEAATNEFVQPHPPDTLLHSFPNPFNSMTTIRFGLPQSSEIDLAIYDTKGAVVRTLIKGRGRAGYDFVMWDGRNEFGVSVASGVYFCRLEVGGHVLVQRMLLLR